MTKIIFLDRGTIPADMSLKKPAFEHQWEEFDATSKEHTVARLKGAEIAITNKVRFEKETLEALPDLKMIAIAATGYDHIDLETALNQGITVANVRGYAVNSVPEHALMLILALSRSLLGFRQDVIDGKWAEAKHFCFFSHPIEDLSSKTLGIVGRGILGQGLARLASGFGMPVMYAGRPGDKNPHMPYVPFDEFLKTADIISLHCPLNDETRDLITAKEFAKMQRRPILINTARGGIVNEADAVAAIEKGQIRGLGFDCLSKEPPTEGNPLMKIAERPNVIITPHVAWASSGAITALWDQLINNIEAYKKGTPENSVQPHPATL